MVWLAALTVAGLAIPPEARATTEQAFQARTTGDLVELCGASTSDPLYTAAMNFCQGFMVGAYQYHNLSVNAEGKRPLVCPPNNPTPSRDESVARFVEWSHSHQSALAMPPVEGMFEFLAQAYPCRG